jgi:hypothetical protein
MRASIDSWQPPQPVPAFVSWLTALTVSAPASIAAATSRSVTAEHWQTYTLDNSLAPWLGEPHHIESVVVCQRGQIHAFGRNRAVSRHYANEIALQRRLSTLNGHRETADRTGVVNPGEWRRLLASLRLRRAPSGTDREGHITAKG